MPVGKNLVIIGAGIVGLSCAHYARQAGFDVTVIDPDVAQDRASYGNAGILAVCDALPLATPGLIKRLPSLMLSRSSPLCIRWRYLPTLAPWLYRFVRASARDRVRASSVALHSILSQAMPAHLELAAAANAGDQIVQSGWLKAFETELAYRRGADERAALLDLGVPAQDLSRPEIDELVPAARGLFQRATLYPSCARIRDPGRYIDDIAAACRSLGVKFINARAKSFIFRDPAARASPCGVRIDGATVSGDFFVIAAGAWSKPLAAQLGSVVPLDTERGYHVMVRHEGDPLFHVPVLWSEKSVVISPLARGIRITSSVEFAGLRAPARYAAIDKTMRQIRAMVPALSGPVESHWLGFRPSIPDSRPVIGPTTLHRNCYLAFGHGHLGLTLGPITGKLIAQRLAELEPSVDLDPFSAERF